MYSCEKCAGYTARLAKEVGGDVGCWVEARPEEME